MLAALTGGCAAIIGGFVFTGGLLVLDVQGLQTLAAQDGWTRPLLQLGGVVGAFGILGFAMGPVVAALGNPSGRKRPKGRHSGR
jgi:hypothetical protein